MNRALSQKHHYIPEFYLKQWTGLDGRLCEYSRPHNVVVPRMKHPGATGYSRGLYTIEGAPPHLADLFENKFMSVADGRAAESLRVMISDNHVPVAHEKVGWTRFMMSLLYRTPEGVARSFAMIRKHFEEEEVSVTFRSRYSELKQSGDPDTADEYMKMHGQQMARRTTITHLIDIIQSEKVASKIMQMQWHLGTIRGLKFPLLTSDRPIVMTNGIAHPTSHIVMPLSPCHIFIATNTDEEATRLKGLSRNGQIALLLNDKMGRQARKYVYGTDDCQLRFVANRLGEKIACSPFE